jgi:CRP-like cAMP-binding protein
MNPERLRPLQTGSPMNKVPPIIPLPVDILSRAAQTAFARKLGAYVSLTEAELAILSDFDKRKRTFPIGKDLVYEGQKNQSAYILSAGWACSYKLLPNGSRQIVDFQLPGDFLGLRSVLFRTADHNVEPITQIEASEITSRDLLEAFTATPRLATAVLWAASRDEAMVVEHLVDLGRRDAAQRMAHFLLELSARLRLVGLGTSAGYECPLSQYLLADALGLSAVHVNRVLRQLREDGLVTFHRGEVVFDNLDRLIEYADFDKSYLDHEGPILK